MNAIKSKIDPTPGRAAHAFDFKTPVFHTLAEMDAALDWYPGRKWQPWKDSAYVHRKTVFGFGCRHVVLNPDGTYFLHDDGGA